MARLIEDGLLSAGASNTSAFRAIEYDANNANDGATMFRKVMIVNVPNFPAANETFGIGAKTYTFKASGATGAQINIGSTIAEMVANICAKINLDKVSTGCTAYSIANSTKILLVRNTANGINPAFTELDEKVTQDTAWSLDVLEAKLESASYFKVASTDVTVKPIVLVEQNAKTATNFLY